MRQSTSAVAFAILGFFVLFFGLNLPQSKPKSITFPAPTPYVVRARPTPKPYLSPTPLPLLRADSDTVVNISSVNEYLTVPKGSAYKTDYGWSITIYPTANLSVQLCWGCDPIGTFKVCGDGYGMGMEGICQSREIIIGSWNMREHYFSADRRFAFIVGPYRPSLGKSGADVIIIHTQNSRYPTSDELSAVQEILDSMYRGQ